MSAVEDLEAKIEARRAARAEAEAAQYLKDLEAKDALEEEIGVVGTIKVPRFVPGQPTRAYVKTPNGAQYKRYVDQIGKAVEKKNTAGQRAAQELLAKSVWIYPAEEEDRASMLEAFPGLLTTISLVAAALAEGKAEDEGKG